jgi:CheY-like chemotaxis protein
LSDADGREVLVPLKRDPSTALIPVVAWAGGREERDSERSTALELGAQDYVNVVNAKLLMRAGSSGCSRDCC